MPIFFQYGPCAWLIEELWQSEGPPSGAPYPYRKEKETHELIFSRLSWQAVLLLWRIHMTTTTATTEMRRMAANLRNKRLFAVFWVNFCRYFILLVWYILIKNNYFLQCWWLSLNIYLAALRLDKYPLLATSTAGSNQLLIIPTWACDPIESQYLVCGQLKKTHDLDEL